MKSFLCGIFYENRIENNYYYKKLKPYYFQRDIKNFIENTNIDDLGDYLRCDSTTEHYILSYILLNETLSLDVKKIIQKYMLFFDHPKYKIIIFTRCNYELMVAFVDAYQITYPNVGDILYYIIQCPYLKKSSNILDVLINKFGISCIKNTDNYYILKLTCIHNLMYVPKLIRTFNILCRPYSYDTTAFGVLFSSCDNRRLCIKFINTYGALSSMSTFLYLHFMYNNKRINPIKKIILIFGKY
jgi:hypothetical protein